MLQRYKNITLLLLAILVLGGCSSKKSDDIEPQATVSSLPKTVKIETYGSKNPNSYAYTWKDNLLTSYTITSLNTSTNRDFVRTYEFTRNAKNQIKTEKYSYKGADYADGSQSYEYEYNTDGSEIILEKYMQWIYNNKGQLTTLNYTNPSQWAKTFEKFEYQSDGQLTKYQFKSNIETICSLEEFTTVENPLYKFTENTQFLKLSYSDGQIVALFASKMIPKSVINGDFSNKITYTLDSQQRVSTIALVSSFGITLFKITIGY